MLSFIIARFIIIINTNEAWTTECRFAMSSICTTDTTKHDVGLTSS